MKYDPNKSAIDNLTATCPVCGAEGLNRVWDCGSIVVSGKFEQGGDCEGSEYDDFKGGDQNRP